MAGFRCDILLYSFAWGRPYSMIPDVGWWRWVFDIRLDGSSRVVWVSEIVMVLFQYR